MTTPRTPSTRFADVCATVFLALWLNVATAAESGTQFTITDTGLKYAILARGTGPAPRDGQVIILHYVGTLADGTEFDSSRKRNRPFAFTLGKHHVIKGYEEAFRLLHLGDKATLFIPPALAYGEKGVPSVIPPDATLTFQIEFLALAEHALADTLSDTIDAAGIDAAHRQFQELKRASFKGYYFGEDQLNDLGYRYLKRARPTAAVACLTWNLELFPQSAQAHDSLAEADAARGYAKRALSECKKAQTLNPRIAAEPGSYCITSQIKPAS